MTYILPYYKNYLTENIGFLIHGTFFICSTVILVNMVIGMMSKSSEKIRVSYDSIKKIN